MNKITKEFNRLKTLNRKKYLTSRATMFFNLAMGCGKIVFGLLTASVFVVVNGFYSLAVGTAKLIFLRGRKASGADNAKARGYFLAMCINMAAASVFYIIYMARLFYIRYDVKYELIMSITIAAISFLELGVSIGGLVRSSKNGDLLESGLKCVNLVSAFTAISLTQVALLSVEAASDMSVYYALGGVVFGAACLLISVYMLILFIKAKSENKKQKEVPPE